MLWQCDRIIIVSILIYSTQRLTSVVFHV